jgi:hypothetical protein
VRNSMLWTIIYSSASLLGLSCFTIRSGGRWLDRWFWRFPGAALGIAVRSKISPLGASISRVHLVSLSGDNAVSWIPHYGDGVPWFSMPLSTRTSRSYANHMKRWTVSYERECSYEREWMYLFWVITSLREQRSPSDDPLPTSALWRTSR